MRSLLLNTISYMCKTCILQKFIKDLSMFGHCRFSPISTCGFLRTFQGVLILTLAPLSLTNKPTATKTTKPTNYATTVRLTL